MRLIKDDITRICDLALTQFSRVSGLPDDDRLLQMDAIRPTLEPGQVAVYADAVDFYITRFIARQAQTFIFDSAQIMEFLAAVDRQLAPGDYPAPFDCMIIQFTEPIPESEFLSGLRTSGRPNDPGDSIAGLIMAVPSDGTRVANVIAWYTSTSINRAAMPLAGDGSVSQDFAYGGGGADYVRDKQRIANLGLLCLAYINSPGIEVARVETPPAINKRRIRDGKKPLEDYYLCRVSRERSAAGEAGEATGRHVSFRFDVRGHFRRLPDGRTVWIRPHQRGVEHELYKPKAYRVE
jgi:hypothetical protein